ncbi:MAG: hypothetical protein U1C33_04995, partial [Candidatus Cloacimonadaceae bacterium]|nr:hypothetical protein [Candidatus Cloacimonadaceae bacterium]
MTASGNILLHQNIEWTGGSVERLLFLNTDLSINWQTNVRASSQTSDYYYIQSILSPDDVNYTIIWNETTSGVSQVYMNRINAYGSFIFDQAAVLLANVPTLYVTTTAILCSDNSIVTGFAFGVLVPPTLNMIRKVTYSGYHIWGNDIAMPDCVRFTRLIRRDA